MELLFTTKTGSLFWIKVVGELSWWINSSGWVRYNVDALVQGEGKLAGCGSIMVVASWEFFQAP